MACVVRYIDLNDKGDGSPFFIALIKDCISSLCPFPYVFTDFDVDTENNLTVLKSSIMAVLPPE